MTPLAVLLVLALVVVLIPTHAQRRADKLHQRLVRAEAAERAELLRAADVEARRRRRVAFIHATFVG